MPKPSAQDAARRLLVLAGLIRYAHVQPPKKIWTENYARWSKADQEEFFNRFKVMGQDIANRLRKAGVWDYLSPEENLFFHRYPQDMSDDDKINMVWRVEGAVALIWSLGLKKEFPPFDELADSSSVLKDVPLGDGLNFVANAGLRSPEELEAKRSLTQSWHWRSRTRQLIEEGRHFPMTAQLPQFKSYDDVVRFSAKALRDEGIFSEIIEEDFPVRGKAYRNLTLEEWAEIRSITVERHFALNWVCGYAPSNRWDETPTET